jgi:hypothetical protein
MKYALLAYTASGDRGGEIPAGVAEVLERSDITGWIRLRDAESATTVSSPEGKTLLTDGPFIDSKEHLGGLIIVDAANLDQALAVAAELQALMSAGGAIEVRPIADAA